MSISSKSELLANPVQEGVKQVSSIMAAEHGTLITEACAVSASVKHAKTVCAPPPGQPQEPYERSYEPGADQ